MKLHFQVTLRRKSYLQVGFEEEIISFGCFWDKIISLVYFECFEEENAVSGSFEENV